MKLKEYLNESMTTTEDFEQTFVDFWNGKEIKDEKYIKWIELSAKVKLFMENKKFKGEAKRVGRKKESTSDKWKKYKKVAKDTPKTDIIIGDKKISIKIDTNQLVASAKDESLAIFYNVLKENNYDKMILEGLEQRLLKFDKGRTDKGTNPKNTTDEKIKEIDKFHKETQEFIKKMFSNNKDFFIDYIKEAMSGKIKFGKDSYASAEYILNLKKDGSLIKINNVDDISYLNEVLNNTSISVRFKTMSYKAKNAKPGERTYFSVLGLIHTLKEEKLDESILNKVMEFIKNLLKKGIEKVFEFFNLEIEIEIK